MSSLLSGAIKMPSREESSANEAGRRALEQMYACLDGGQSFRLEAGAGAGKTYSLEKALSRLIESRGADLIRQRQQVACITYTNVAKDEIISRFQAHPAIRAETVHGFCWSLLKDFQTSLRGFLGEQEYWRERLDPIGGIGGQRIHYEMGIPRISDEEVSIRHEDVLTLMIQALAFPKFRAIFVSRYPVLLIDEYQDTDEQFFGAIRARFLDQGEGPMLGLFGDHWQKIYGEGCGLVVHDGLHPIEKNANFRSAARIVGVLNNMRPALPQMVSDPGLIGEARVFHTNLWAGIRRTGQGGGHWTGDTSADAARDYFVYLKSRLRAEGWDFSPEKTKILILNHNGIAREQGYASIPPIYGQYNDAWLKKEDPHIKFLTDQLEPACTAYAERKFGEMFVFLASDRPTIQRHQDKTAWSQAMELLSNLRLTGTVGDVIDYLRTISLLQLPEAVLRNEQKLSEAGEEPVEDEPRRVTQLRQLRAVRYTELIALDRFIDGHTPFATKHGVKGAEFENVIVVLGRGWNKYNFVEMLEWIDAGPPVDRLDKFESNRNLFYVACSRPKVRLALLFTQLLSPSALRKLTEWFGAENVVPLPAEPAPKVIQRSFSDPDRQALSWEQIWQGPDRGLIKCWEMGRALAHQDSDLAERCRSGALPPLNWKGGVSRALKKKEKFGALQYLAQWQGLRGDDLCVDLEAELKMSCSTTGMVVTFTPDLTKLADQQNSPEEGDANG
ncbi:UvrD-helicase domain-containing protein [Pseudomonas sp.]|uniref:UvrD-helicase domain-containing protein n=1 Tax=Pseudomonas sp. TaxID=306 RepID=UPI003D09EF34